MDFWCGHHMMAHLWRLSLSFMLSLFGFILSIGLIFEIVRIIVLVFEIVCESLSLLLWFLEVVYKAPNDSFVFYKLLLLLLLRLFAETAQYLFGGDSKHLRWEV